MSLDLINLYVEKLKDSDFEPDVNISDFNRPLLGDQLSLIGIYTSFKLHTSIITTIKNNPHIFIKKGEELLKVFRRYRRGQLY